MRPLILLPLLLASAPAGACEVEDAWPAEEQVVPAELIEALWRGRDYYVEVYTLDNDGQHIELVAAPPDAWGSDHPPCRAQGPGSRSSSAPTRSASSR